MWENLYKTLSGRKKMKLTYTLDEEIINDPPYNPWGLVALMEQRLRESLPGIDEFVDNYYHTKDKLIEQGNYVKNNR
jgi:hypothetical protein